MTHFVASDRAMKDLAATLTRDWPAGTVVLLEGPLGAGKTTFARGVLEALGHVGAVRSPTFNLLHEYPTDPPVLHADLYRLGVATGLGLEDYYDTHLCLIEWPDRLAEPPAAWRITIEFGEEETARIVTCQPPNPP
jgi:tRNA threonylcarbamoyladenosine biosynthesis protein TsaE